MVVRELFVWKHASWLGNAHAHTLFESVVVKRREDVQYPRSFADYDVTVNGVLPEGVGLRRSR